MSHLETLIAEFLDWQGYLVRRNTKVGRLKHGGWAMELDVIGDHPQRRDLVHDEPSVDAHSWAVREHRYRRKFDAARKHILTDVFTWLPADTPIRQIAVFPSHPRGRDRIAGGQIQSIDEVLAEIRAMVAESGPASRNAIPEGYPLLRTLQLTHCGYMRALAPVARVRRRSGRDADTGS